MSFVLFLVLWENCFCEPRAIDLFQAWVIFLPGCLFPYCLLVCWFPLLLITEDPVDGTEEQLLAGEIDQLLTAVSCEGSFRCCGQASLLVNL